MRSSRISSRETKSIPPGRCEHTRATGKPKAQIGRGERGTAKCLRAAIRCADALVKNFKPGDEVNSPWPVRAYARDGKAEGSPMGPYSANVIEPIMLFDELMRLGQGGVAGYTRVRAGAWEWFQEYPLAHDVW